MSNFRRFKTQAEVELTIKAINSISSVCLKHTDQKKYSDSFRLCQTSTQLRGTETCGRRCFFLSARRHKIESFILADIGEGITEVDIKEWYVKEGDHVSQFDNVCEVQSDKASVTITSRFDGVITKLHYGVDDTALVGKPLFDIQLDDAGTDSDLSSTEDSSEGFERHTEPTPRHTEPTPDEKVTEKVQTIKVLATPAVRRIAAESKVDLKNVRGSGKDGRVMKDDILAFLAQTQSEVPSALDTESKAEVRELTTTKPHDRIVPIQGFLKAMAKTMSLAQRVPHFVYCDEINVTALHELRQRVKPVAERRGIKLTALPFIIKATSIALSDFPKVNACVDQECTILTIQSAHNIGVAVDSPNGLIVPNIKDVQNLGVLQIATELNRLQKEATAGTLKQQDLTGGTFTLSNIGAIGGTYASPVLLVPEVAIGALGKIQTVPRFLPTEDVAPVKIMNVSWGADHRVLDGATIARFSNRFKDLVENPEELLL